MSTPTVNLVGEGGVVWQFELPLGEAYLDQVKKHVLTAADDESAELLAELFADDEPDHALTGDDGASAPDVEKPLDKMKLAELIKVAEKVGVPAETLDELRKPGASKASAIAAIEAAKGEE